MQKEGTEVVAHDLEPLVAVLRLLSDKTRLRILMALAKGERHVGGLCEELGLPQPTVSHHLSLLRSKDVISNRRSGKQVFYAMNGKVDSATRAALRVLAPPYRIEITDSAAQP